MTLIWINSNDTKGMCKQLLLHDNDSMLYKVYFFNSANEIKSVDTPIYSTPIEIPTIEIKPKMKYFLYHYFRLPNDI